MSAKKNVNAGTEIVAFMARMDERIENILDILKGEDGLVNRVRALEDESLGNKQFQRGARWILGLLGTGVLAIIGLLIKIIVK